jgi:hypothetical protein
MSDLTPREKQVLDALTDTFDHPDAIAQRAGISTISPRETASTFCRKLVKRGLAVKGGTAIWRKRDTP